MKQDEIARLLPEIYRRTLRPASPLGALLGAMEALQAPPEDVLANLEAYFSPQRAPDPFVAFLAQWVDLAWLLQEGSGEPDEATTIRPGLGQLREVVAASAELAHWRGTARGLTRFLELATGLAGFCIEEEAAWPDGRLRPFHIVIRAPAAARSYQTVLDRIVQAEKPVYMTHGWAFDA